jgi:hypothetical protein
MMASPLHGPGVYQTSRLWKSQPKPSGFVERHRADRAGLTFGLSLLPALTLCRALIKLLVKGGDDFSRKSFCALADKEDMFSIF